jgi:hypothetical protein
MSEAKEELKKARPDEEKVEISAILFLDKKMFGPKYDGRSTLDYLITFTEILNSAKWVKRSIVKGYAFPKEEK